MPFAYYMLVHMIVLVWDILPRWRQVTTVLAALVFGAIAILNYYWFYLIMRRAAKVLKGSKQVEGPDDEESKV